MLESVSSGAAGSWSLSYYGPKIIENDFDPGFYVEHFIKDIGIALAEAERMQLELPGLVLAKRLYDKVAEQGHSRDGIQCLAQAIAGESDFDWTARE